MCGATLLPAPTPAAPPPRDIVRETVPESLPQTVSVPRPPVRTPTEVPPISGHSFLGLNQPSSSESARGASLGRGASQLERSSGSLDYLLEDEEEPRGGGAGKIFAILMSSVLNETSRPVS